MPFKGRRRVNNKNKTQRRMRKQVSNFPKQIQNAAYIAPNRLVKFTDFRSYIVKDTAGTLNAQPPVLQMGLNDPTKFIESVQGTWQANSLAAKGAAVPGLTKWLSNKVPGTTTLAEYLTGSCVGARLDITVVPLPPPPDDISSYQKVCKVALANQTRFGHLKGRAIDLDFNSERVSELPMVRTANIYLNSGGTPRGTTMTLKYSFRKNNAAPGKQAENLFYADTSPVERDLAALVIMPGDSNGYGITGTRCFDCRVEVRVSYIVLLSEPNTHIGTAINDGNNLSMPAQVAIDRLTIN